MLPPHLLDSSWARLEYPTSSCPTPQPWKCWMLQAGCGSPVQEQSCQQLTWVWAELCSFPGALCPALPAHPLSCCSGLICPLWSSRGLAGLIFSHTNMSGAEKEEILGSSQTLGWFKLAVLKDTVSVCVISPWVRKELGQSPKCFGKYCICMICNGWVALSLWVKTLLLRGFDCRQVYRVSKTLM